MAKVKNLTVSAMKKIDAKEFGERKQIDVNGYAVEIDKKFRKTKITLIFAEIIDKRDYCIVNKINFNLLDLNSYIMLLIVKNFTSVDVPDDFGEQLRVLDIMVDNDFMEPIMKSFDQDQLKSVYDMLGKFTENVEKFIEEFQTMELQNADILRDEDNGN